MKNLLSIADLNKREILDLIHKAIDIKNNPKEYSKSAYEKTLLMIFELPSLRTRVSFNVAMTQLGGHAINYDTAFSPWGIGKETIEDTAKTISKYCNLVMVRINDHNELIKFTKASSIPVINGLTSYAHPCQIISDLMTIKEKKKKLENLKISYFGDGNNNVTHDLIFASSILGLDISVACPRGAEYESQKLVLEKAKAFSRSSGSAIEITTNPEKAIKDSDVVYTDSWMSYRIPKSDLIKRMNVFRKYQVNSDLFEQAKEDALFMHCLPAIRGHEVTSDVIDSKRSIVWNQVENRLHSQKSIILWLLK